MKSVADSGVTTPVCHLESAFLSAITAAGLDYQGPIIADGALHRFKANGDPNPNSFYTLHLDHPAAGIFGCWRRGIKETWCAVGTESLTEAERAERDLRWKEQQRQRDAERAKSQNAAKNKAEAILDAARPATDDHPYLVKKAVKAAAGLMIGAWPQGRREGCLLIPLRNAAGQLATLQAISPDAPFAHSGQTKDFLKGGAKTGSYFVIGDLESSPIILLAEGYATAATLHAATGYAAVMACDAGNLKPVAMAMKALYPSKPRLICGDNDRFTEGNPGVKAAQAAAKASWSRVVTPQFADDESGSDFNDLAALRGADAVWNAVEQALSGRWQAGKEKAERPQTETERSVTIQCIPGELPEMADKAESALCKFEANFYQRGGQLVRWCMSHAETVRGITRPGGAVIILNQDADYLLDRLNRLIQWQRWNEDKEDFVPCNAPRIVANTLLARRGLWKAQPLVAAINAPTLRPDGSILDQPGYDAATGLLFVNTAVDFPLIPQQPTRQQAEAALAFLYQELLSGFPFAEPHDQSAALSAILTGLVRHALKNAPMHTFNAPVMASGKSLLADVVAMVATGHPATVMSYTPDGDEMRKRVLSVLMQGDLVVNLDNVEEPLSSQTLCTVLTQESFTDRILGVNKTGTAPTLCCWIATGNNLVVAGDLTTRIVPCNLDPKVERPEEREFQRNLYEWIPANRPALVQAGLTVLRAYIVAGKPKQPIKTFARFEDWSGLVRAALVWLGEADPLTGREQIEDGDPVRVKLRALLLAWWGVFKSAPATSKEAVIRANETRFDDEGTEQPAYPAMKEALEDHFTDKSGKVSSNSIGYFLRQYAGRIISGARFEAYGNSNPRQSWRIVILDDNLFKREREKILTLPEHPYHPYHPYTNPHPNTAENVGNPHSTVSPPDSDVRDARDDRDVSPNPVNFPPEIFSGQAAADALSSQHPPVDSHLTGDPATLAGVLKHYRGAEMAVILARKLGWGMERTLQAAQGLAAHGLAEISGDMIKPAARLTGGAA